VLRMGRVDDTLERWPDNAFVGHFEVLTLAAAVAAAALEVARH